MFVPLLLAACQSDEERTRAHLARAEALVAEGQLAQARIEYRNFLDLRPNDAEVRFTFAEMLLDEGATAEAAGHFRRVVEQEPLHFRARLELASLALMDQEWDLARSQITRMTKIAPEDLTAQIRKVVLSYADLVEQDNGAEVEALLERMRALRDAEPGFIPLHRAIIDAEVREGRPEAAMQAIDVARAAGIRDLPIEGARLQLLLQLDRIEEIEPQFREMMASHPEDARLPQLLSGWLVMRGDLSGAAAVLKDAAEDDGVAGRLSFIRFLAQHRGIEAALRELEPIIAEPGAADAFHLFYAALTFDSGQTDAALARVDAMIDAAREARRDPSDTLYLKAQMLAVLERSEEAEEVLDTLIAATPAHVAGAQILAEKLLARGQPERALGVLIPAANAEPENPDTLDLMSRAYAATGRPALAREMQSRAFEASGEAAQEGLNYARLLVGEAMPGAAIEVLEVALAQSPQSAPLLIALGDLVRVTGDWDRAEALEPRLRALGDDAAQAAADRVRFDVLAVRRGLELAMRDIGARADAGEDTASGYAATTQSNILAGRLDRARTLLTAGLQHYPEDRALRAIAAALATAEQDHEKAAGIYRALLAETPQDEALWIEYIRTQQRRGDAAAVAAALAEAGAALPESDLIRWEQAIHAETQGQTAAAVALYETLLEKHGDSAPVRNNLASLLSGPDAAEQDLARAAEIATPLAGSVVPQFLDTYGWVQFRQGETIAALPSLLAAANALPTDLGVQLHLAEALVAAGRHADARAQLEALGTLLPEQPDERLSQAIGRLRAALPEASPGE